MYCWIPYRHHQSQPTVPLQGGKGNLGQPWNRIGFWFGVCHCYCCLVGLGFFFRGDSFVTVFILPPIQSCICDLIPCHQGCASTPGSLGFAARPQGQAGRDSQSRASFSNREQRKLARRPDISISFPVSGMRGSSMPFTLTLTLSHPYTHTPTQEMVGLSEPTVVHKACTSASYI